MIYASCINDYQGNLAEPTGFNLHQKIFLCILIYYSTFHRHDRILFHLHVLTYLHKHSSNDTKFSFMAFIMIKLSLLIYELF